MVANPERRALVLDVALDLLGREGARALTHRAVDAEAGLPAGTSVNYYRSRADLLVGMAERIFVRLAPEEARLRELAELGGEDAFPAYVAYVVERLLERPTLALALLELRLEAARTPAVARRLTPVLRARFEADAAFHAERGLPGGREAVLATHHAVNGLILDALTISLDPSAEARQVARSLAARLGRSYSGTETRQNG